MTSSDRESIRDALLMVLGYIGREFARFPTQDLRGMLERISAAIGKLTPATLVHDEGAYARCSVCGRFSAQPCVLSTIVEPPMCDCGAVGSWSNSFVRPGPTAQWSVGSERRSSP